MRLRLEVTTLQLGEFIPDPGPAPALDAGEEAWVAWLTATPTSPERKIPAWIMLKVWEKARKMGFPLPERVKLGDLTPEDAGEIRMMKPLPHDRDRGVAARVAVTERVVFDGICVIEIEGAKAEDVALFGYILQEMVVPFTAGSIKVLSST